MRIEHRLCRLAMVSREEPPHAGERIVERGVSALRSAVAPAGLAAVRRSEQSVSSCSGVGSVLGGAVPSVCLLFECHRSGVVDSGPRCEQ